jgi:uncharacterized protein (TIGR00661 family)
VRILYGVVGEGMGHATRSRAIIERLAERHDVEVMASGRARAYLARTVEVRDVWGLTLSYDDNAVRRWATVAQNLTGAMSGWPRNVRACLRTAEDFAPEVVVTDFESLSHLYGRLHGLPVISLDNIQAIDRLEHPPEIIEGHHADFRVAQGIVRMKVPGCVQYLITSFFTPPARRPDTTLVPPILRPQIVAAHPEPAAHLLVYSTAEGGPDLAAALGPSGIECRVYGVRRSITSEQVEGNLRYRPFSEDGFIEDLRTARGVVAGGGFTLMSECVGLRRPMLSVPVGGQFEQVMNARYLESMGYGLARDTLSAEAVDDFLAGLPGFAVALQARPPDDPDGAVTALEAALARAVDPAPGA